MTPARAKVLMEWLSTGNNYNMISRWCDTYQVVGPHVPRNWFASLEEAIAFAMTVPPFDPVTFKAALKAERQKDANEKSRTVSSPAAASPRSSRPSGG